MKCEVTSNKTHDVLITGEVKDFIIGSAPITYIVPATPSIEGEYRTCIARLWIVRVRGETRVNVSITKLAYLKLAVFPVAN